MDPANNFNMRYINLVTRSDMTYVLAAPPSPTTLKIASTAACIEPYII